MMELNKQSIVQHIGVFILCYLRFCSADDTPPFRVEDKLFPTGMTIHNRVVECSEEHKPGNKFPSFTWTCENMRVGGMRMAYGYNPSITKDDKCKETKGRDELAEVCRRMMHVMGAYNTLWVAFVTNATCNFINEKRVFLNMTGPSIYEWELMKPGYGWIDTLRCMAVK